MRRNVAAGWWISRTFNTDPWELKYSGWVTYHEIDKKFKTQKEAIEYYRKNKTKLHKLREKTIKESKKIFPYGNRD